MPAKLRDNARLVVTLSVYLEAMKLEDRNKVPSIEELAEEVGVSRTALYNLVNGTTKQLNLLLAGRIIHAMRSRGFPMELTDLLAYRE